jgi:hypothetical protein
MRVLSSMNDLVTRGAAQVLHKMRNATFNKTEGADDDLNLMYQQAFHPQAA